MSTVRQADLIQSIADAVQFISFYLPADVGRAHESGPREWRARIGKIPVTVA